MNKPDALVLVQIQDAEGFWCNIGEALNVDAAMKSAKAWAHETKLRTRVVKGPKREFVRSFSMEET